MEGIMVNEMFWTHCCHCGYRISNSAPGTKSLLVCPKCGKNLNEGACACPQKEIDPRLLVLKQLLEKEP